MVVRQAKIADIIKQDKAVDYINSTVGASGPNSTANSGRMFVVLKPKNEREPMRAVIGRLMRATVRGGGHSGVPAADPEHQYRRTHFEERIPVHLAERRHRRAVQGRARTRTPVRAIARIARRHDRPLHQEPADAGRHRSREGGGLRHHGRPDPAGIVQRLRLASGLDHLHAVERLSGHHGNAAEIPGRPGLSVETPDQDVDRPDHPDRVRSQSLCRRSGRCRSTIRVSSLR